MTSGLAHINGLLDAVTTAWPEHARFLHNSFAGYRAIITSLVLAR